MDIVGQFRDIWKLKVTNTSNAVFKLHGRFSVAISLVFAVLVSAKQYFGDPIDCFVNNNAGMKASLDKYCWIIGTYTSKKGFSGESFIHKRIFKKKIT
jgi:innexin